MLIGPINSGAAVGGNGVATSTGTSNNVIRGVILAVQVKYNDAPPAGTTVVTVKTKGTNAPTYNILVITNAATDGVFCSRLDSYNAAGTALLTYDQLPVVEDYVQVVIAGANAADNVDVYLYVLGAE